MADLVAVAAYGKVAGLDNQECMSLWARAQRAEDYGLASGEALLDYLDKAVMSIKVARAQGLRDSHQPVMDHEAWVERRKA